MSLNKYTKWNIPAIYPSENTNITLTQKLINASEYNRKYIIKNRKYIMLLSIN